MEKVRIDKWLWAVRIFKTRTIAADACRKGRVLVSGIEVKPSRFIEEGVVIQVKKTPIVHSYRVVRLAEKRVSAKVAVGLVENITPESELEKLEMYKKDPFNFITMKRERGSGRPTKKERRDLDRLKE